MPFKTTYAARRMAAALAVLIALAASGHAQDATLPGAAATKPKKTAPEAKAMPGQWALVPESDISSKLAWQYTPGASEFLAIAISCDVAKRQASIVVDLSTETNVKASQRLSAKITKGDATLAIAGRVQSGESGPFIQATMPSAQIAQLLDQPGDLIVTLPHHRLSFSAKTLPGPYASFKKSCQLGKAR